MRLPFLDVNLIKNPCSSDKHPLSADNSSIMDALPLFDWLIYQTQRYEFQVLNAHKHIFLIWTSREK